LRRHAELTVGQLIESELEENQVVTLAGLITSVNHRVARNSGNPYAQATLEDFTGEVALLFLGKAYTEAQPALQPDQIVEVRGRIQYRDDAVLIQAQAVTALSIQASFSDSHDGPLTLSVPEHHATVDVLRALDEALERHEGRSEVRLRLVTADVARVFQLPRRVHVSTELIGEVKSVLGPNCLAS
jgi:DNA polymerase-3 subunit alpha